MDYLKLRHCFVVYASTFGRLAMNGFLNELDRVQRCLSLFGTSICFYDQLKLIVPT